MTDEIIDTTIRFRNRFRILFNGEPLRLNSVDTSRGHTMMTEGFETLKEAIAARTVWAGLREVKKDEVNKVMPIERYSLTKPLSVPHIKPELNEVFKANKTFSGRGLKYKSFESKADKKYVATKWYGGEVGLAQSAERNKGLTVNKRFHEKKERARAGATAEQMGRLRGHGEMNLEYSLVESLKKKGYGKKKLQRYLRDANYSMKATRRILAQVFAKD